jgi:SAM-dependent methyltransferase
MSEPPEIHPGTIEKLLQAGSEAWDEFRQVAKDRHHLFIPCDQPGAYETLRAHRAQATTFLELGSGAGIVTILADLLGFEACGIEIEPWLVERSTQLAAEFDSGASFAEGTFVPLEYQDEIENLSADFHTPTGGASGFDELGLDLSDFDLVFAYPWPDDEDWLAELFRRHARPDATLLTYDVSEGFRTTTASDAS